MASTSMSLGPHWEAFIKAEVDSGRYASASEVVRAALRELEDRSRTIDHLRAHLAEGAAEAERGDFAPSVTAAELIADARARLG